MFARKIGSTALEISRKLCADNLVPGLTFAGTIKLERVFAGNAVTCSS